MSTPQKRPIENSPFRHPLELITAANRYDRFRLLNDASVLASDLDNPIHPLFRNSNFEYGNEFDSGDFIYEKMKQALRLASMFLQRDAVLEWFVVPLLGRPLQSLRADGKTKQTYLSNPLANKSESQRSDLINEVRKALHCLSKCITFRFLENDPESKVYARTVVDKELPPHEHTSACTKLFTSKHAVRIEIRPQYMRMLLNEYDESSRCKQFRLDFNLAISIVHEICHAVGVMRRGNLSEPYLRCDHPKAEFGQAWENSMFGAVMNPFDQDSDAIGFVMRRIWSDNAVAKAAGGKEWTAVPMSYIAQWFRKDTWDVIAERGPAAIPPPHVDLKIISTTNSPYYTVYSDSYEKLAHINAYKTMNAKMYAELYAANKVTNTDIHGAFVNLQVVTTDELQRTSLTAPTRAPNPTPSYGPMNQPQCVPDTGVRCKAATLSAKPSRSGPSSDSPAASQSFQSKSSHTSPSASDPSCTVGSVRANRTSATQSDALSSPAALPPRAGNPLKRRKAPNTASSRPSKAAKL